jgi:hypothetical protein
MQAETGIGEGRGVPDTVGKIRRTVRRLREFGRDPRSLLYATSQRVPVIDKLENDLSEELNVRLTIRDGRIFQRT